MQQEIEEIEKRKEREGNREESEDERERLNEIEENVRRR